MFLDLQKAFVTVNHDILLKKLNHYVIRGTANNWFCSFLNGRMQFTSINKSQSGKRELKYGVQQGSVLGPLLFILFISDLHKNVEFSTVHHFADDTNMPLIEKSLKKLNRHINRDLKLVVEWIRANKLSLNTSKTDLVIFKSRNKKITKHLNFRISGQKIQPTSQVKYLGVTLQDDLHWATQLGNLRKKLSHSIGLLSKIRHYVPKHLLRTLCYSLFNSHLIYACEIWGQNQINQLFKRLLLLQEKAIRIINFQPQTSSSNNLFKENRILKISDYINYKHALFVRNSLRKENLPIFNNMFTSLGIKHTHNSRAATNHLLDIPRKQTTHYGTYSMTCTASVTWNDILRNASQNFVDCKITEFKRTIFQTYLAKYGNNN